MECTELPFEQPGIWYSLCAGKARKVSCFIAGTGSGSTGIAGAIVEAEKGMITLEIGIHGIPVTLEPSVYASLSQGGLYRYQYQNWDNRDEVYYKRVYMGCVRAVDYLCSMKEFVAQPLGAGR